MTLNEYLTSEKVTQSDFAKKLDLSQAAVSKMVIGDIPSERVLQVSEQTQWKCTPHELRPDLYPHKNDGLPEHLRKKEAA